MRRDPRNSITILGSGAEGYGHAVAPPDLPEGSTYHWTYNWNLTIPGRAVPTLAPMVVNYTAPNATNTTFAPVVAAVEWEETTPFRPFILYGSAVALTGQAKLVLKLLDGAVSGEDTNSTATAAAYTNLVLYRNGDTEMVYGANGYSNAVLRTRNKAGTYADAASTKADLLAVIGSDLYIVVSGYKIQKLTAEADPATSTNYRSVIPVGRPTYAINTVVNVDGSPVCMKGDGLFTFNGVEFICQTPMLTPHPDHGKGGFADGRGRAYFLTADGDILVFQPGFQSQQRPVRFTTINRDTPGGRILELTADMEGVYAVTEPGATRTASTAATPNGMGLVVKSTDGGVFTTHTTNVTDGQFNTVADLTLLTADTDEALYIGCDEPFLGAYITLQTPRTAAWSSTKLYTEYASAGPAWNIASNTRDGTAGFTQDGAFILSTDGSDLNGLATPWVATTVDGVSKYWMRIYKTSVGAGTNTLAGVKIREMQAIPYRPPLDASLFPVSQYAIGGALPKILYGTWAGERLIWHDLWTLDAAKIDKLLIARGECGGLPYRRVLYAFNHEGVYGMPLGFEHHPARAAWPKLADYGEAGTAQGTHIIACSGIDFGSWVKPKPGAKIEIDFPFIQSDDTVKVHSWWDEDAESVLTDNLSERSIEAVISQHGGRVLYVAVSYSDGARDEAAPYIREISLPGGTWEYSARPTKADLAIPLAR